MVIRYALAESLLVIASAATGIGIWSSHSAGYTVMRNASVPGTVASEESLLQIAG